ncbi:MAG: hypothetical protein QF393_03185 [Rhodospirillales bacterium]|jgi:hypothetical protein|nr:hypothetical protein [Rhodospirillaceae bacterium]MDP6426997.1 hypothetical protein [Rhodospirillales bacterium]MDP6644641.1 hypothetical protein [Rhodospirillales bacterium]|tara:strand:- start:1367 stop:1924 length:558 start_codon:yes stop_codon:yes gene_type:complete
MHRSIALALLLALTACASASPTALVERAEAGDGAAQFELGKTYARGDGVEQDFVLAEQWFAKAAANDFAFARQISSFYARDMDDTKRFIAWSNRIANNTLTRIQRKYRSLHCLIYDEAQSHLVNSLAHVLAAAAFGNDGAEQEARFIYLRATNPERVAAKALADRCVQSVRDAETRIERMKRKVR